MMKRIAIALLVNALALTVAAQAFAGDTCIIGC